MATPANKNAIIQQIKSPTLEAFGHALAGATAGAFALCLLYPLDQIKVRKAVRSESRILTFRVIADDFMHLRIDNIMDIYRGLSFGILEQFSFNGVYFFCYQYLQSDWKRKYATKLQPEMPWLTALIRGSIAGLLTQLFTTPLKVIQLRLQTASKKQAVQIDNIVANIYNQHGITGFWSGMKASAILVVNPALVQLFYSKIRQYLTSKLGHSSAAIDFFAGALSKALATVISYPLVLIKMNLQAGSGAESASPTPSPRDPSPMSLRKSNPFKFASKKRRNNVDVIKEEEESQSGDEEMKKADNDELSSSDPERDSDSDDNNVNNGGKKKKRVQFEKVDGPALKRRSSRTSMSDIFASTIKERGIFGLYSGLGPKLVHASLQNAIIFTSKEKFVLYTFAMMVYLSGKVNDERKLQKMTQIANTQ